MEKLSKESLMIGDWVYCTYSDKPCQVLSLETSELTGSIYVKVSSLAGMKEITSLTAIPITPKILENNGFVKQEFDGWECMKAEDNNSSYLDYRILWRKDYDNHLFIKKYVGNTVIGTLQIQNIEYVHQLQHALGLFNINKNIAL